MPVVEGKTGKYCQIIFKIFLSFLFWKGHTRYSIWKLKKNIPGDSYHWHIYLESSP